MKLSHIDFYYNYQKVNENHVIKNVSLEIKKGEWLTIMGQSGSGKSTLLKLICHQLIPQNGMMSINDQNIDKIYKDNPNYRYENIGLIFQNTNLLKSLTIRANMYMVKNENDENFEIRLKEYAKLLEVDHLMNRYPYECSGGQQQRLCILKALLKECPFVIGDEPTGNLDSENTQKIMELLSKIHNEGKTILLVSHNVEVASQSTRVLFLNDGQITAEFNKENKTNKQFRDEILEYERELFQLEV